MSTVQRNKSNLSISSEKTSNQKTLPQDLVKTIGKARIFAIDLFAKISAFFNFLKNWFLGNSQSFEDEYSDLAFKISYAKKLKFYSDKKLNADEKAFLNLIGTKISSFEDLIVIEKKIKKDKKVFNLLKAIVSKANKKEIENILKEVKQSNPKNYKLVLKAADKLASDQKASEEIKAFLKSKLEKVKDNSEMRSKYKKPSVKQKKLLLPRPASNDTITIERKGLSKMTKIAIRAGVIAATASIFYGLYSLYAATGVTTVAASNMTATAVANVTSGQTALILRPIGDQVALALRPNVTATGNVSQVVTASSKVIINGTQVASANGTKVVAAVVKKSSSFEAGKKMLNWIGQFITNSPRYGKVV